MIIGISAKMGCGKTALANILLDELPEFKRIAFADVLKQECSEIYKYPLVWNYTEEGKKRLVNTGIKSMPIMEVRELLQHHGTDIRRKQDYDYWIKAMDEQITDGDNVIIDDVRFPNEADFVKKREGILVRINPYPEWKPEKHSDHISETALDDYKGWNIQFYPKFGELERCAKVLKDAYELGIKRYIKEKECQS